MRGSCQAEAETCGYQRHHQVARRHPLGHQWFHVYAAQYPLNLSRMALACLRVTKHQWEAQHFLQRNSLVLEQVMPCWHRHHQRIVPDGQGDDTIANFIGAGEPHVVQVVIQTLDLLRQRHLEQADFDFGSSCRHSASSAGKRDGVMPSDKATRNWPWKPLAAAFTLSRACCKAAKTRGT